VPAGGFPAAGEVAGVDGFEAAVVVGWAGAAGEFDPTGAADADADDPPGAAAADEDDDGADTTEAEAGGVLPLTGTPH